jgi:hypothetical protein
MNNIREHSSRLSGCSFWLASFSSRVREGALLVLPRREAFLQITQADSLVNPLLSSFQKADVFKNQSQIVCELGVNPPQFRTCQKRSGPPSKPGRRGGPFPRRAGVRPAAPILTWVEATKSFSRQENPPTLDTHNPKHHTGPSQGDTPVPPTLYPTPDTLDLKIWP